MCNNYDGAESKFSTSQTGHAFRFPASKLAGLQNGSRELRGRDVWVVPNGINLAQAGAKHITR